eukprot:scaffold33786_cov32-Tisochrysis_lutea.AAC.6
MLEWNSRPAYSFLGGLSRTRRSALRCVGTSTNTASNESLLDAGIRARALRHLRVAGELAVSQRETQSAHRCCNGTLCGTANEPCPSLARPYLLRTMRTSHKTACSPRSSHRPSSNA